MDAVESPPEERKKISVFALFVWGFVIFFIATAYGAGIIFPPVPNTFGTLVIKRGMNAEEIGHALKEKNIIRSEYLFVWAVYLSGVENRLAAGKFVFSDPSSLFGVIRGLTAPQKEVMVLIPEGTTASEIQELLARNNMAASAMFLDAIKTYRNPDYTFLNSLPKGRSVEGFLFPDTYRFYEYADAQEIIDTMVDNFAQKIAPSGSDIAHSSRALYDVVILASILEKEVRMPGDMAIVSGILSKRIERGMPLQVDATLVFETGKTSAELTGDDLRRDSLFNTYTHKGLPPGPIGNPGIAAIRAALYPTSSPYMFYLSDKDGVTHYARTFEEHKRNKILYLAK